MHRLKYADMQREKLLAEMEQESRLPLDLKVKVEMTIDNYKHIIEEIIKEQNDICIMNK